MATTLLQPQITALLSQVPQAVQNEHIAHALFIRLPGNQPPWQSTGLNVQRGHSYSLFASGRIQWSARNAARHGGPSYHLWARVAPGGHIVNLTQSTGTFVADVDGVLELGLYMGVWKNAHGELATSTTLYERLVGQLECWAVVWRGNPARALAALVRQRPDTWFLTNEMVRLAMPVEPPTNWHYLLETGSAEIFTPQRGAEGRACIALDSHDDQGIITTPTDFPLTRDTTLRWRWRGETLPSEVAENTPHTHDYFSIATEFDNGRDLTWMWSACLAPETHFHCPVPAWSPRETHFVVRSGTAALGEWQQEARNVYADVEAAMGAPPSRIVRVWLIAVTTFQHQRARAMFADIVLSDHARELVVL